MTLAGLVFAGAAASFAGCGGQVDGRSTTVSAVRPPGAVNPPGTRSTAAGPVATQGPTRAEKAQGEAQEKFDKRMARRAPFRDRGGSPAQIATLKRDIARRLEEEWRLETAKSAPPDLAARIADIYSASMRPRMLARMRENFAIASRDENSSPTRSVRFTVTGWQGIDITSPDHAFAQLSYEGSWVPTRTTMYDKADERVTVYQLTTVTTVREAGRWRIVDRLDSDPPAQGG